MCSCFEQTCPTVVDTHLVGHPETVTWPRKRRVRPTDPALAIGASGQTRLLRFGLVVDWSSSPVINARQESLTDKPMFATLTEQRIVIPAGWYVEWQKSGDLRGPMRIFRPDQVPLFLAGLWDGNDAFCLITTQATSDIAMIHSRMPVLLSEGEAREHWLAAKPFHQVADLLPCPSREARGGGLQSEPEGTPKEGAGGQSIIGDEPAQPDLF